MYIELTDGELSSITLALGIDDLSWGEAVATLQGQFEMALSRTLREVRFVPCDVCGKWDYQLWEHQCPGPPKVVEELLPTTRIVTVPLQRDHAGVLSLTVELDWRCPVCGGPRGTPEWGLSYDGSRRLAVHVWTNPCGHVDQYESVRAEAQERRRRLEVERAGAENSAAG